MYTFKLIFCFLFFSMASFSSAQINPSAIEIVRDKWGVPHIYAKTNAEVSYGLAWAHAEDDFQTIQETLLAIKNKLGSVKGKDGAILDMVAFLLDVNRIGELQYEQAFSSDYKKILTAYVQGINDYAQTFPAKVLAKNVFPVTEKEMLKGAILTNSLLDFVQSDIKKIFDNTIGNQFFEKNFKNYFKHDFQRGSNGIAMNSSITADGGTYVTINSHQPLEGAYAWYEAHLHSEEGMNIIGGTFPGGPHIVIGTNENLSWAHTLPYSNLNDVYLLEMHPTEPLKYKLDNQWLDLEVRKNTTLVKLGFVKIPISKTFYRSVHGPVIESNGKYYALRFPASMKVNALEQWYNMSLATNFTEFKEALNSHSFTGMNVIYGDKEDNIYFLSAGLFPNRNKDFEWKYKMLPGNTSSTLWNAWFYSLDSVPSYTNPSSGYVFNMNSTPFNATDSANNLQAKDFNPTMGFLEGNTARSYRFTDLINQYEKVSWQDFHTIKFDQSFSFPLYNHTMEDLDLVRNLSKEKYPDLADVIDLINTWNGQADVNNTVAPILAFAIYNLITEGDKLGNLEYQKSLGEDMYVDALRKAKKHLLKHFKTISPRLGDVQKHVKGNVELEIGGLPECLAAMYTLPYKNGKRKSFVGDSYIQMVRFLNGEVEIYTSNAFGASNQSDSPHYTDQMELHVNQKLKTMTFNKEEIYRNAKAIYTPFKMMQLKQNWYKVF